jgi:hypothetical protein
MTDRTEQALALAVKAPVAVPVIGASLLGSLNPATVTQWAAMCAALLYVLIQAVTLYRGIAAARRERAEARGGKG